MANQSYGIRLKQARRALGITQIQLAERAGIAVSSIRRYEAGEREPMLSILEKCANAMGLSLNEMLNGNVLKICAVSNDGKEEENNFTLIHNRINALLIAFAKMNNSGQLEALERIQELSELSKYQSESGRL